MVHGDTTKFTKRVKVFIRAIRSIASDSGIMGRCICRCLTSWYCTYAPCQAQAASGFRDANGSRVAARSFGRTRPHRSSHQFSQRRDNISLFATLRYLGLAPPRSPTSFCAHPCDFLVVERSVAIVLALFILLLLRAAPLFNNGRLQWHEGARAEEAIERARSHAGRQ
jgi:hypothetical protein